MKPRSFKFSLGAPNEALARSLSIKSMFWLLSGSTPVNKIKTQIVVLHKGFWGANDFGGRVRRQIDFKLSGSIPVNKSSVLEVKIELWLDACR